MLPDAPGVRLWGDGVRPKRMLSTAVEMSDRVDVSRQAQPRQAQRTVNPCRMCSGTPKMPGAA
jgi:hypothetical protein